MKIKFNTDVELTLVTNLDQDDEPVEETEVFRSGEEIEVDFIDFPIRSNGEEARDHWNVQVGNGAMIFGLSREWFDIVQFSFTETVPGYN